MGFTDLKNPKSIQGSDSVYIDGPTTGFGEVRIASITPQGQGDFVYGVSDKIFTTSSFAGGSVASVNGMCELESGTDPAGSATVQLRRGLKYRSGQASLMRITALYGTPDAGNAQFVGAGNSECGYFIGYFGTNFGILHSQTGQREVRTYTVSAGAGTANLTVTLDGDSISVPVTGAGDTSQTAYQLSLADYSQVGRGGWLVDVIGSTVYFVSARSSSEYTGSYSVAGSTVAGTFTRLLAGENQTNTFIPSASFNVDRLDGTGPTEMTIDTSKGNVFEIAFQYLGFGNASFSIEDPQTGKFVEFHKVINANNRTTPVLKNPNVNALATSANIGGTTSTTLKTVSIGAFIEGQVIPLDPKFGKTYSYTTLGTLATYKPFVLFKVNRLYRDISCFGELDILKVSGTNTTNNASLTVGVFLDAEVSGDVNYQYVDQQNSITSYAQVDPATQTITNLASIQPIYEITIGPDFSRTEDLIDLRIAIGVGRPILLAVKTTGNVNTAGSVSVNWFEQQ
jgi:hypothetical protein